MNTYLNLTPYTPQMTFGVCALLRRLEDGTSVEDLKRWLAPASVVAAGTGESGFTAAVDVAIDLGMIEQVDGLLHLTASIGTLEEFRHDIRTRIMSRSGRAFEDADPEAVDELNRALAWWNHMPSVPINSSTFESHMPAAGIRPIRQQVRWQVFERWATFLGFAWRLGDEGLVADPSVAVRSVLDSLLPAGSETSLRSFLGDIAELLPVVDGGLAFAAYRRAASLPHDSDQLEPPQTLALLRLERRGDLAFRPEGDGDGVTLRYGDVSRRIVRVTRIGEPTTGVRT